MDFRKTPSKARFQTIDGIMLPNTNAQILGNLHGTYSWLYCPEYRGISLFRSWLERGFSYYKMVEYPRCGNQFGEIRVARRCNWISEVAGDAGNGSSHRHVPELFQELIHDNP